MRRREGSKPLRFSVARLGVEVHRRETADSSSAQRNQGYAECVGGGWECGEDESVGGWELGGVGVWEGGEDGSVGRMGVWEGWELGGVGVWERRRDDESM